MAETFKNAKLALGTTLATIYTCPSATTAIVLMVQVANIDDTSAADATILWTDSSDSDTATYLAKLIEIPSKAAYSAIQGKMILEAGDNISALANVASKLELSVSVLEIS